MTTLAPTPHPIKQQSGNKITTRAERASAKKTGTKSAEISMMIVDDFPLVREALATAIRRDDRLDLLGVHSDARAVLDALVEAEPDVLLCDLHLPDMEGPELIERIKRLHPKVKVMIVSACEKPGQVLSAMRAGAAGYSVKRQPIEQIIDAAINVSKGDTVLAPQVTSALVAPSVDGQNAQGSSTILNPIDLEIVRRVVRGATDYEIAGELFVSTRTVQNHLARIRKTAGVKRRTEIARWAWENSLV